MTSKKWRMDAFPDPQANYMQLHKSAESRSWLVMVVCIGQPSLFTFSGFTVIGFDDFPRKGRGLGARLPRRRGSGRGRLPTCRTVAACSFLLKKSTLSKVQIPRCRRGQSPTTLFEVHAVRSPRCPKSNAVKKKVKIWRESDSIGRASQRPPTRLDECPDPVGSRPAPDTFPDLSPESDSSRFARSLNLPIVEMYVNAELENHLCRGEQQTKQHTEKKRSVLT